MNKELCDRAWNCLPREFREEVKKLYVETEIELSKKTAATDNLTQQLRGMNRQLAYLFGHHNLTSDADGEEMLTVSRKQVQKMFAANERIKADFPDKETAHISDHINHVLKFIFGDKCLPDETAKESASEDGNEDNFATKDCATCQNRACTHYDAVNGHCRFIEDCKYEPSFKVGDKVLIAKRDSPYHLTTGEILDIDNSGKWFVLLRHNQAWFSPDDLRPYVERINEPEPSKEFDNIVKDGFQNERRLNIASRIMAGIISNYTMVRNMAEGETTPEAVVKCVTKAALMYADELIKECNGTEN